jgi:hypothetical protein
VRWGKRKGQPKDGSNSEEEKGFLREDRETQGDFYFRRRIYGEQDWQGEGLEWR